MRPILRPLPIIALAAMLAGCGTANRGLESVHQPVVERSDYAIDVATAPGGLRPGESQRLDGWMRSMRLGFGDRIAIDDPNGAGRPVREDVQGVAAHYGLLVADEVPVTGAPVAPGTFRVVVSRARATVPGCPDMSRLNDPNFNAHTGSDYGCAINSNLAAMVANPADLVRGATGDADMGGATGTRAINARQRATPTGQGGAALAGEKTGGR